MRKPKFKRSNLLLNQVVINLDETTAGAGGERAWQQVASSGEYRGYAGGKIQFELNEQIFDQIIANFRGHPSYLAAADGFGNSNVIPWDFNHASEMPPNAGSVPSTGAPAQGWIQELATRRTDDGKVELWALTHWLEPARSYVKEGRYQWASVSVVFDAVDAISGAVIGPILTSVALTNQPFIEGMEKLAAERYKNGVYIEAAETPERALEMIRNMLGLPETADAVAVMAELAKVRQWVETGSTPTGIDLDDIVGGLRIILNLPALSTDTEVFANVDILIARLLEDSGVDVPSGSATPSTPVGTTPPPPPDASASTLETQHMELLKLLAEKFGIDPKGEAVIDAVDQLLELRGVIAGNVGLELSATTKVVLKAASDDAAVRAKYGPVLTALGVEDPDAALDKIATLISESAQLTESAPEFAALKARAEAEEKATAESDVEAAVAATGVAASSTHYESTKVALATLRQYRPEEFAKRFPEDKLVAARAALSKLPAGVKAETLTTKITASASGASGKGTATPGGVIDVSTQVGRNLLERTCSHVRLSVQGADKWDHMRVVEHASGLVKSGAVAA